MQRRNEKGFSLVELLIVVAIILILAAIAIPSLIRSKMAANEASAVGSLRTINTSIVSYASSYGGTFPSSLADMAPSSSPSSTAADLLDAVLSTGTKSGYLFEFTPGAADSSGNISSYTIIANPITPMTTGQRSFYTDQTMIIRWNASTTASASDPPIS